MTSIGLLTVSTFLSNQQTRLAVENGHQMGSMDRDYFTDHYQPPHSLKADDKDKDSETEPAESQEDSSERRGRQRREKRASNRKGKRDEKVSKALVVNNNIDDSQQQKYESTASTGTRIVHHSTL
jgi:hypothetical protein